MRKYFTNVALQLQGAANPTSAGPSGNSANSTTIAHAFAFLALRQENIQDSGRRSSEEASGSEIRTDTQLSVDASLLDTLSDLCSEPGISRDFLAYVLCRRCAGDMQVRATTWKGSSWQCPWSSSSTGRQWMAQHMAGSAGVWTHGQGSSMSRYVPLLRQRGAALHPI